jgi:hypothetical protein
MSVRQPLGGAGHDWSNSASRLSRTSCPFRASRISHASRAGGASSGGGPTARPRTGAALAAAPPPSVCQIWASGGAGGDGRAAFGPSTCQGMGASGGAGGDGRAAGGPSMFHGAWVSGGAEGNDRTTFCPLGSPDVNSRRSIACVGRCRWLEWTSPRPFRESVPPRGTRTGGMFTVLTSTPTPISALG